MIKLKQVSKIYPDGTEAVKGLSLEINKGEFCIFLGPSGCGKTTSMKMINRLIPLTSGTIYIDNVDIMKLDPNELRRTIGYAIQNIGLFPHFTVEENIATVPMLKKWSKSKQHDRAAELLELVGMDPATFLDRYPSELSGGQQQRVGVARCLGADPPILLMDEPFGAIDPITRNKLQEEFLKIQSKIKKTIAFVTHDINEAIKMGDKIALLREGELVQYSDPTTLLNSPKNEFVRNFVGADRVLKGLRLYRTKDIMQDPPLKVKEDDNVVTVKQHMEKEMLKWAMLVDEKNRFLGWITHEDLMSGKPLREVMVPPAITTSPETPLNEALSMMFNSAIGNLAVVDNYGKLLGVLTFEIIRTILAQGESKNNNKSGGQVR
jgi:osmoprotectant transport system ATP-binding protein